MTLETERLIMRPFSKEDADLVFRLYSDEETLTYTPFDVRTRAQTDAFLDQMLRDWEEDPPVSMEMALIRKEDGEKIGRVHILLNPDEDSGMIGYMLLRPFRGQHYATEAAKALTAYCFETLGLHRVYALCHPGNPATHRVLESCGMQREACLRKKTPYRKKGRTTWEDELVYAVLSEEWNP